MFKDGMGLLQESLMRYRRVLTMTYVRARENRNRSREIYCGIA